MTESSASVKYLKIGHQFLISTEKVLNHGIGNPWDLSMQGKCHVPSRDYHLSLDGWRHAIPITGSWCFCVCLIQLPAFDERQLEEE